MIAYDISIKYMIAGYAVIFIVLAVYLASLVIRWKRLKADLQTLEKLEDHQ
jgi:CcmD family protein